MQSIDVFLDFMYLISYICQMKATDKKDSGIRELYFSDEFTEFYEKLQDKVKAKFEHTMDIIRTEGGYMVYYSAVFQSSNLQFLFLFA